MEKALEILKQVKELPGWIKCGAELPFDEELDEAIAELEEAMKPKTCEGCVYGVFGVDSFGLEIECTLAYKCSRGQNDMFKPKDNA